MMAIKDLCRSRTHCFAAFLGLVLSCFPACRGKQPAPKFDGYDPISTHVDTEAPAAVGACAQVAAENLRARKATMVAGPGANPVSSKALTVTRTALWVEFKNTCGNGACHVAKDGSKLFPDAKSPAAYTLSEAGFNQRKDIGTAGLTRILATNPTLVMPPGGDGTPRRADDPIRLLGEKLQAWEEAGFPDTFTVQNKQPTPDSGLGIPGDPYLLTSDLAANLTNIGSCLPSAKVEKRMDEVKNLDALFAKAQSIDDLPETLAETDLVSLDSQALAQRAVYSYAPTYTLFSDHASKMRYVRVPMGTKVTYNPEIKDFDIPTNTRFYKTFLRKVTDKDGEVGYRKMETRLIVSRPDKKLANGSYQTAALMVVYAWDKDERMARKVTDPLTSQKPWADRMCPYIEDEREARTEKANPISPAMNERTCTYMTEEERKDLTSGRIRHYAIPSQERCVQCHMGSNNHSFILGFTPWHVDRRKPGEGGTFEAAHEDELDQLKRLTEYGVIAGIAPGQAKLEDSQGDRKPRNDHELTAQGYMMGNCAFCHRPDGFPNVENPVLKDFELFPSKVGGIFQFPLEKLSPRAKVGPAQTLRFPYITPALGDFPMEDGGNLGSPQTKKMNTSVDHPTVDWLPPIGNVDDPNAYNDPDQDVEEYDPIKAVFNFRGPWRSLIWRNVATPFTYEEDNTIFIHMPRNVPGFDCRAKRIMAEWMLSIPSVPKLFSNGKESFAKNPVGFEQPFQEVRPGDLPFKDASIDNDVLPLASRGRNFNYDDAVRLANKRVKQYLGSIAGQDCPEDRDIVDAMVVNDKNATAPIDQGKTSSPRANPAVQGQFLDAVPDNAHWVPVDNTQAPGVWRPRRANWKEVLVDRNPAIQVGVKVKHVIDELQNLYLTPERQKFSTELLPMGIWKDSCRSSQAAAASKTVGQLRNEQDANGAQDGSRWVFDRDDKGTKPIFVNENFKLPVHQQSRGEAVFRAICLNCHGKDIDSRSPLATTILELSGGTTRVANFRDGIYGPVGAPGQFAETEFARAGRGGTPADWQARYMVFMGMGGTESKIPEIAINLVSTSPFYGSAPSSGQVGDANMLESARSLCATVLSSNWNLSHFGTASNAKGKIVPSLLKNINGTMTFIKGTGHFELWASLCGFQNTPQVRVFNRPMALPAGAGPNTDYPMFEFFLGIPVVYRAKDQQGTWIYPTTHPVGTLDGTVEKGIQPSNKLPWCVAPRDDQERQISLKHFRDSGILKEEDMPFCPGALFTKAFNKPVHEVLPEAFNPSMITDWSQTGAINTGVAAYYFMDGVTKGKLRAQPTYDECGPLP